MVTREARRRRDGHQGGSAEEEWSLGRLGGGGMVTREARRRRDGHQGGSAEEGWSPGRLGGGGMVGECHLGRLG